MPRYYYASVIDGDRKGLLMGPFDTHQEALDAVPRPKKLAYAADPKAPWYAYGTAGSDDLFPVRFPEEVSPHA